MSDEAQEAAAERLREQEAAAESERLRGTVQQAHRYRIRTTEETATAKCQCGRGCSYTGPDRAADRDEWTREHVAYEVQRALREGDE